MSLTSEIFLIKKVSEEYKVATFVKNVITCLQVLAVYLVRY